MSFLEIVKAIMQDGMSVVIIAYFLYRDWKYNEQLITLMSELKQILSIYREENEHGSIK